MPRRPAGSPFLRTSSSRRPATWRSDRSISAAGGSAAMWHRSSCAPRPAAAVPATSRSTALSATASSRSAAAPTPGSTWPLDRRRRLRSSPAPIRPRRGSTQPSPAAPPISPSPTARSCAPARAASISRPPVTSSGAATPTSSRPAFPGRRPRTKTRAGSSRSRRISRPIPTPGAMCAWRPAATSSRRWSPRHSPTGSRSASATAWRAGASRRERSTGRSVPWAAAASRSVPAVTSVTCRPRSPTAPSPTAPVASATSAATTCRSRPAATC